MVNKKGGKKHKRGKNHNNGSKAIRYKDEKEAQEYAQIKKCKGKSIATPNKKAVTKNFPGSGNLSDFQIIIPNKIGGSIVAK